MSWPSTSFAPCTPIANGCPALRWRNGGGGIFDFLPRAEDADRDLYEEHIATPVDADLSARAPEVRELRTDRATNVRLHRELVERVAAAL
jgi:2-succinyl-5-enolpyruvyl-6-hydroxy-3-cyclohexene-1-carboxylate synthase